MKKESKMIKVGEMYKNGQDVDNIAKELQLSVHTVRKYLKDLGFNKRNTEKLKRNIFKLYGEGYNTNQIAYELDCSVKTVSTVLKENGLGKQYARGNECLIDENTKYAEDLANILLEKIMIDGKMYEDITPIFSPR